VGYNLNIGSVLKLKCQSPNKIVFIFFSFFRLDVPMRRSAGIIVVMPGFYVYVFNSLGSHKVSIKDLFSMYEYFPIALLYSQSSWITSSAFLPLAVKSSMNILYILKGTPLSILPISKSDSGIPKPAEGLVDVLCCCEFLNDIASSPTPL